MLEDSIKKVLSDDAFVKTLAELKTVEEVQEALKEKDMELSIEETTQLRDTIAKLAENNGELSLDDLEGIAGGSIVAMYRKKK